MFERKLFVTLLVAWGALTRSSVVLHAISAAMDVLAGAAVWEAVKAKVGP